MSARMLVIEAIAVVAGAVIGALVAGFCAWLFAGEPFMAALFSPAGYVLALVCVVLFAVAYAKLDATPAVLASLAIGVVLPTIVERFAFASLLSWPSLIVLNLIFAIAALSAYRFVHANGTVRDVAARASDAD